MESSVLARGGLVTVLLAVFPSLAAPIQAPPRYELRLSDRVGEVGRYRATFEMRIDADFTEGRAASPRGRQLMEAIGSGIRMKTVMEYEQELEGVGRDGVRTFELRWQDYDFQGSVGDRLVEPPPGHGGRVQELLSRPVHLRATPLGRTVDVDYGHPQLAQLAGGMGGLQGAVPAQLPERPIAVGDRWSGVVELPMELPTGRSGSLAFQMEHELQAVEEGPNGPIAVIGIRGSYSHLRGVEEMGRDLPMHLEATLTGRVRFDVSGGHFLDGGYQVDLFALHSGEGGDLQLTGHATGGLERLGRR